MTAVEFPADAPRRGNELVAAYLRDIVDAGGTRPERKLSGDGPARDRLLSIFDIPADGRFRGCPFHNAAVEAADEMPDANAVTPVQTRTTSSVVPPPVRLSPPSEEKVEGSFAMATISAYRLTTQNPSPPGEYAVGGWKYTGASGAEPVEAPDGLITQWDVYYR